jgi:hypothetical protein
MYPASNPTPMTSVIIPSYNCAYLKEAVDSVLTQTFEALELIIVDCSSDETCLRALDDFDHPKIRVFRRSGQHLPGSNRNFGIERASGEFILCLDADDIIEHTFLEEALFVASCVDYSLIGTSFRSFGERNKTYKLWPHPTLDQIADGDAFVVTVLMRKELWRTLGGFRDHALGSDHIPEDWDFFLRAIASGATLYNRGSYGFHYRKHYDSLTAQPDMPILEEMQKRMRARHQFVKGEQPPRQCATPAITRSGWRQLVSGRHRQDSVLLLLPEQINGAFEEKMKNHLSSVDASIIVLSTCQIETFPPEIQSFWRERGAQQFSLPDFLEDENLWLEFIKYLGESRNVTYIMYGPNEFFLSNLSRISEACPGAALNYVSRYTIQV